MSKQHLIIVNGTSSAGKTSLAKLIEKETNSYIQHYAWDIFLETISEKERQTDEGKKGLSQKFHQATHDILSKGNNIVLELVCESGRAFDNL